MGGFLLCYFFIRKLLVSYIEFDALVGISQNLHFYGLFSVTSIGKPTLFIYFSLEKEADYFFSEIR